MIKKKLIFKYFETIGFIIPNMYYVFIFSIIKLQLIL